MTTKIPGEADAAVSRRIQKPIMPRNRVVGFATLATHIGGIPGCSMETLSIGAKPDKTGRTSVQLGVRGRGPSLHASIMIWKGRADISDTDPERVGDALIATFRTRIERQRTRATEAMAVMGTPLPWPFFETNTSCLHLAVDRMSIWAEARHGRLGPHETPEARRARIEPDRLRQSLGLRAAQTAKIVMREGRDTGMAELADAEVTRIREIRVDGAIMRQITLKETINAAKGVIVEGSCLLIGGVRMPETLRLAACGRRLSTLMDLTEALGQGFTTLVADRVIVRVDQMGECIYVELVPDLVRIDDIGDMTIGQITGGEITE